MIEQVNGTTFRVPVGDGFAEIGNKDNHTRFEPHVMLPRWDGECFVKLLLPTTKLITPSVSLDGKRLEWRDEDSGIGIDWYATEPRVVYAGDENSKPQSFPQRTFGGFETDIILYKKPLTNQIILEMESSGLRFAYQKPLHPDHPTWCLDSNGKSHAHRPLNVIGSYAVYGFKQGDIVGGKQYGCGKAGHIYRDELIDAIGQRCWPELLIENGRYIITIPWEFLLSAVYPIRRAAGVDFGYVDAGASNVSGYDDLSTASEPDYTPVSAGTGSSMFLNCRDSGNGVKCAIYLAGDDSLLMDTDPGSAPADYDWAECPFTSPPDIAEVAHTLRWKVEDSATNIAYDDPGPSVTYHRRVSEAYGDAWADPQTNETSTEDREFSVKAAYTPSAPGVAVLDKSYGGVI